MDPLDGATSARGSGFRHSDVAVSALRCALQSQLRHAASPAELRTAVRLVCDDARQHEVRVEQLIVLFKDVWASLPEVRDLPRGQQRADTLGRLITLCITEYFRDSPGGSERPVDVRRVDAADSPP